MTPDELRAEAEASKQRRAAKKIIDFAHIKPEEPSLMAKMRQRKVCDSCGKRLRFSRGDWLDCGCELKEVL